MQILIVAVGFLLLHGSPYTATQVAKISIQTVCPNKKHDPNYCLDFKKKFRYSDFCKSIEGVTLFFQILGQKFKFLPCLDSKCCYIILYIFSSSFFRILFCTVHSSLLTVTHYRIFIRCYTLS